MLYLIGIDFPDDQFPSALINSRSGCDWFDWNRSEWLTVVLYLIIIFHIGVWGAESSGNLRLYLILFLVTCFRDHTRDDVGSGESILPLISFVHTLVVHFVRLFGWLTFLASSASFRLRHSIESVAWKQSLCVCLRLLPLAALSRPRILIF